MIPHVELTAALIVLFVTSRLASPEATATENMSRLYIKLPDEDVRTGVGPNNKMANAHITSVADRQTTEASGGCSKL